MRWSSKNILYYSFYSLYCNPWVLTSMICFILGMNYQTRESHGEKWCIKLRTRELTNEDFLNFKKVYHMNYEETKATNYGFVWLAIFYLLPEAKKRSKKHVYIQE